MFCSAFSGWDRKQIRRQIKHLMLIKKRIERQAICLGLPGICKTFYDKAIKLPQHLRLCALESEIFNFATFTMCSGIKQAI